MANVSGVSWGATTNTLGDPGGIVTWSIAPGGLDTSVFPSGPGVSVTPGNVLNFDFEARIAEAFQEWSTYGNIEFLQVPDGGGAAGVGAVADIRIFFGSVPGSALAWAFFPTGPSNVAAGDIIIDIDAGFNTQPDNFSTMVLHEIGHTLGLDHEDGGQASVMTSTLSESVLQQDDIEGIRAIYGPQDDAPLVYTLGTGQIVFNIMQATNGILVQGNAENNLMNGASGADAMNGGSGQDTVLGALGNDTLLGESGFDWLDGGDGDDRLDGGGQADNLFGRGGMDTLLGGQGLDRLFGGAGNDVARGGEGNDGLFGQQNDDRLFGEAGNDRFFGGQGNDLTDGGAGNDTIFAGAGFDTILGGAGNDRLQGDFNADRFVFADGHGDDIITDFASTNIFEKIDLRGVSAITNLNDLLSNHASQAGGNVLIDTGGGHSITLLGVSLGDLDGTDFVF